MTMTDDSPNPLPKTTRDAGFEPGEMAEAVAARDFKRNLAVIIGINDYGNGIPALKTARQDAERLAEILREQYEYTVELLVDEVSGNRLRTLLSNDLATKIGQDDRLVFYFAGHGVALDGDDGPAGYLIPQDADVANRETFLPMQLVHEALTSLPCRHCLIILDCCFSGAFRWSSTRRVIAPPEVLHQERYERFVRSPAWQVLTSAAYDQEALDNLTGTGFGSREDEGQQHSPFAQALFDALEGKGDANDDGVLIATELYLYLRDNVEVRAEEAAQHYQTPGLWPLNKHDKGEFIFVLGEPDLPPAPEPTAENNPYRGLQSFDEAHAHLFFGRAALIEQLAETVIKQPLTVVLGASGTGKSSLVKAGLAPYLRNPALGKVQERAGDEVKDDSTPSQPPPARGRSQNLPSRGGKQGGIEGGPSWHILKPLRPTASPLSTLETRLKTDLPDTIQTLANLSTNPQTLAKAITHWRHSSPQKKLLLIVDQFEELITLCRDDAERDHFLELLLTALQTHPDQFRLVITLRSDFEPQIRAIIDKLNVVYMFRFIVPPMSQDELREAIEGPAGVAVLYFEPLDLVDKLINEVIQTPGALPLLSFTLSELYMRYLKRYLNGETEDRALIEDDYKELGGVIGSLSQRATAEYDQLDEASQDTMRRIMLRMIAVEGGELARRRVPRSELVYPDEAENERVKTVIHKLIEARLLVIDKAEDEVYVEPAHDALVQAWDKLLTWSREDEEYLPLQRRLTQAANDWAGASQEKQGKLLWHNDARLPQVEQILEQSKTQNGQQLGFLRRGWRVIFPASEIFEGISWLNQRETDFVQRSVHKRANNVRRLMGTVAAVIIVLVGLTIFAFNQQGIAEERRVAAVTSEANAEERRIAAENAEATAIAERDISRSRQLAAQSEVVPVGQSSQSLLLALEALHAYQNSDVFLAEPRQALYAALQRPSGRPLGSLGITSDRIIFSPDQRWLAAGDADGVLHLWSLADLDSPVKVWPAHDNRIVVIAISPDGQWLASGDIETIRLWSLLDLASQPAAEVNVNDGVAAIAFSPDSQWLFIASEAGIISQKSMTDLQAGSQIVAAYDDASINDLALSPDGQWLAAGSNNDEAYLWSRTDLESDPETLNVNKINGVEKVLFSPDSQWLLSAGATNVQLWPLAQPDEIDTVALPGTESQVFATAFSPDGRWLATGSYAHTVHLWSVDEPTQPPSILEHGAEVVALAFRPDGQTLLTVGEKGLVREWSLNRLQKEPLELFTQDETGTSLVSFSPDGQWLATTDRDEFIRLLPTNNLQAEPFILDQGEDYVETLVFSADSQWIITGSDTGRIWRWSLAEPQARGEIIFEHPYPIRAIAITTDGLWLASSDEEEGGVQLWSLSDLQDSPQELSSDGVYELGNLAFSPDGLWLAGGEANDPMVWVWSMKDLGEPRRVQADGINGVVVDFSADGQYLAAATEADTVQLWSTADTFATAPLVLRGHTDFVHSLAFSPDKQWLASGSIDGTIRLWPLAHLEAESVMLRGYDNGNESLAFSPDGQWLLVGAEDRPAQLWQMDIDILIALACQYAGRNFTLEEWDLYFRGEPYRLTCSEWPPPLDFGGDVTE